MGFAFTSPGAPGACQVFYLSHRSDVDAIPNAAGRVKKPIRLVLGPNKDAFGKEKDGTPNRKATAQMMKRKAERGSISWCGGSTGMVTRTM